ncbi:MAG TPA: VCBS repeat-containing protein [Dermatophilaceae bacterium]|nr:VCBS repeat-containing protein [Dermatophilaceae bacterium]
MQQPTLTLTADTFGVDATDIDVADFNRDGIQDLVVAVALNGSRTAILIGNGDGSFRTPSIITEPNQSIPHFQAVADYNRDGFLDLALSLGDGTFGLMQIRNGNGDGTFQAPVAYLVPPAQSSISGFAIIPADFTGDAVVDLAQGVVGAAPSFAILLNSTGVAPPVTPTAPTLLSPGQDSTPAQPVVFDWSDVSGAATYRIQVDDSSTFSAPLVVDRSVTASQLTSPTLAARRHWWRVRGVNAVGTAGAWSTVRRFVPQAATSAASLSAVAVSPSTVVGGGGAQGTVTLTAAAPTGGAVVALSSSSTVLTHPSSVTVTAGSTSAGFAVTTSAVSTSTSVTVTGTYAGVSRSATVTVSPPVTTVTLTVSATGRSGERITSSPAGLDVAVGSTGSAPFAAGTAVTLTVSNGRSAVWSGACSSGGNKTPTCTFSISSNAQVNANVQ